jgi:hypothetical protein
MVQIMGMFLNILQILYHNNMAKWTNKLFGIDSFEDSEEYKKQEESIINETQNEIAKLFSNLNNENAEEEDSFSEDSDVVSEENYDSEILSESEFKERVENIKAQINELSQQFKNAKSNVEREQLLSKIRELNNQISLFR